MNSSLPIRKLLLNRWSLQLAATIGLLAFAIGRVDVGATWDAIRSADYAWAGLAILMSTASKLLAAVRWRLYLSKVADAPLFGLMGAYVIGTMLNSLLPFRAGDFAKIQIVASRYKLSRAVLSSSVFTVEAVLDALALLLLFLLSLAFLGAGVVPNALIVLFILAATGGALVAILASRFLPREMPSKWPLTKLSPHAQGVLREAWPAFLDGMITLRDRPLFTRAFSLHIVEWLMRAAVLWFLGIGFDLGEGPATFLLLTIVVSIATLFPITFANFGTYQVVVTEVLVAAGVTRESAFAFALAAHAIAHAWVVVMGAVAMVLMQVSSRQAISMVREQRQASE